MPVVLSGEQKKVFNRARAAGLFPEVFAIGESVYLRIKPGSDISFMAEVDEHGRWTVVLLPIPRLAWTYSNFQDPGKLVNGLGDSLEVLRRLEAGE